MSGRGLAVALLCLLWGSTWLVIRDSLTFIPPFLGAGVRFLLAGALMALLVPRLRRLEGGTPPPVWLWATMGTLNFATSFAIVYHCEQVLDSGLVAVLWAVFPLFMAIGGQFVLPDEGLTPRKILGLLVGFGGVALLFSQDLEQLQDGIAWGALLLVSPLVTTVGMLLVKRHGQGHSSAILNRNAMLCGGVLLLIATAVFERGQTAEWNRRALLGLGYLVVAGTVVTNGLLFWLLRTGSATRLSLIAFVTPCVAVALGYTFADEQITAQRMQGCALVIGGVFLVVGGSFPGWRRLSRKHNQT